ncbi:MAG: tetratricopeptide repeat protein [Chthoniobacter sp.]
MAPEDGFSHCTLGIVFYSQGKYDEAVNELTKALAIDPKNATAHNYLGITASQKGWQEAAQKELETATSLDPNYADANFNLAVVFATQTPPNKENAPQILPACDGTRRRARHRAGAVDQVSGEGLLRLRCNG